MEGGTEGLHVWSTDLRFRYGEDAHVEIEEPCGIFFKFSHLVDHLTTSSNIVKIVRIFCTILEHSKKFLNFLEFSIIFFVLHVL